jgi:hypothetical protein
MYYEGREFEVRMREKRPGDYSDELLRALGMASKDAPPPWLYNMQRYGPPPAYPSMQIPGVNAPIPPGGRWGLADGEWGKPPVDEYGRPLFGDIFGVAYQAVSACSSLCALSLWPRPWQSCCSLVAAAAAVAAGSQEAPTVVDKTLWGQVAVEAEDEGHPAGAAADEDEEGGGAGGAGGEGGEGESEEDAAAAIAAARNKQAAEDDDEDMAPETKAGIDSVTSHTTGLDTPDNISIRKRLDGTGTETPDTVRCVLLLLPPLSLNVADPFPFLHTVQARCSSSVVPGS